MIVSRGTTLLKPIVVGFLVFLFFVASCGIHKSKYIIDDYVLVPNAKNILGNKGLTAYVFENNKKIVPFQNFAVQHFNLSTYNQKEIPFTYNNNNFILHIYDVDEINKYINTSDFALKNQIPDASKVNNISDFIVLSVVNDKNEDCLLEESLYQNMILKYLKNLKEEYLKNDR
ncbi:hypothetical protein [Flavobacterium sp.]|uniref:hypothetical protein n=1 Tax=Flavobacterium sp. TaxID=239 RepID=UPI002627D763|nr:hypothetical protein [Flavobacterium sp.]MDD3004311.1 hypothetical protein [Flavobacterium sp.]